NTQLPQNNDWQSATKHTDMIATSITPTN
ncbi:MAG: hypothetical protein QOJ87_1429, partial [Verrucomicrobiota bacterium]